MTQTPFLWLNYQFNVFSATSKHASVGDMEVLVVSFKMSQGFFCSVLECARAFCVLYMRVCVCIFCVSCGQGRSVWVMLRTAVVQMKEATCSLPFLHFLTSIIYTFLQTYKQPPIRPTLTHSTPVLCTHTYICILPPHICTLVDAVSVCMTQEKEREGWGWREVVISLEALHLIQL